MSRGSSAGTQRQSDTSWDRPFSGNPLPEPGPAMVADRPPAIPFRLLVCYLLFECARPQATIPFLSALHIPAVLVASLAVALWVSARVSLSDAQTKAFIVLLGLMAFHVPLALNNYWALQTLWTMLATFIAYLAIIAFAASLDRFSMLVRAWLIIHTYVAVVGIAQGGRGIAGLFGDENDLAMTLNMVIPFAFFLSLAYESWSRRWVPVALTILVAFAVVLTHSRGGFVGLAGTALYCWLRSPAKARSAACAGLAVVLIAQIAPSTYWTEVRTIQRGTTDATGEERIYQWKMGWLMFLDNPIVGVGQGNYPFEFRRYEIAAGFEEGLHGRSRAGRTAHSAYFTLLPELGLVGALAWSVFLYGLFKDARLTRRMIRHYGVMPGARGRSASIVSVDQARRLKVAWYLTLAIEASAVAYLLNGVFLSVLYYPNLWLLCGFGVALRKAVAAAAAGIRDERAAMRVDDGFTVPLQRGRSYPATFAAPRPEGRLRGRADGPDSR